MKVSGNFCFLGWICRALRDRQIQSQGFDLATNFAAGKISLLAGFLDVQPALSTIGTPPPSKGRGRFALPASPDAERGQRPRPQKPPEWNADPLPCRAFPACGDLRRTRRPFHIKAPCLPAPAGEDGALCVSVRCAPHRFPWAVAPRARRLHRAPRARR